MTARFDVPPDRLERWVARWAQAHGGIAETAADGPALRLVGADGATARLLPPFPPPAEASVAGVLRHARRERTVGVLLVRLGAHAAGVFEGQALVASKVARRQVHARHRKGGSSSGRFARRRENQAQASLDAAAAVAERVLVPRAGALDAVVLGGDRRALAQVMQDARLAPLRPLVSPRVIDVPEPRLAVLRAAPELFLATSIETG